MRKIGKKSVQKDLALTLTALKIYLLAIKVYYVFIYFIV